MGKLGTTRQFVAPAAAADSADDDRVALPHRASATITSSGVSSRSTDPVVRAVPPNQQLVTMRLPRAIGTRWLI